MEEYDKKKDLNLSEESQKPEIRHTPKKDSQMTYVFIVILNKINYSNPV